MSKSKSIFAKLKQAQAFEPQVCPILVNGDTGAECKLRKIDVWCSSACVI